MLFKASNNADSDAKAPLSGSDPFEIDGTAMYLASRPGNAPATAGNTSTTDNDNRVIKPVSGPQVKKTFKAAKMHRQAATRSGMPPPSFQVSSGQSSKPVQRVNSSYNEAVSRVSDNIPLSTQVSHQTTRSPHVHQVMPKSPTTVSHAMKAPSFQDPLTSNRITKRLAVPESAENAPTNDSLPGHAQSNNHSVQATKDLSFAQKGSRNHETEDARPTKRRRVLVDQDDSVPVPQVQADKPTRTSNIQVGDSRHAIDTTPAEDDIVTERTNAPNEIPPSTALAVPTTAFQKYAAENSGFFQTRKSHWATCSMEMWLAGGEEIVERFSRLLTKGVAIFEANMGIFDSIDESLERYKKDVLDNRDQVLRQAKETIREGCGPLLSGAPSGSESTSEF